VGGEHARCPRASLQVRLR
jgi:hypothetical protein